MVGYRLRKLYLRKSSLRAKPTLYQLENKANAISQNVPSASLIVAGVPERGIFRRRLVPPVADLGSGTLTSNMVKVTHLLYSAKSNDGPVISPGKKKTYPK